MYVCTFHSDRPCGCGQSLTCVSHSHLLNGVPPQSQNTSLLMTLLGYNAENWHMDAEYMCVHFIMIDHGGVGSR
jgi:hypothetical protein